MSELTARSNDEGWDAIFSAWLEVSRLGDKDAMLVYSVGGGDLERNISPNIVKAADLAKARSAKVFGIVGRDSGYVVVVIPQIDTARAVEAGCAMVFIHLGYVMCTKCEAMHNIITRELPVDAIKVCYHGQADECSCRNRSHPGGRRRPRY